MLKQVWQYGKWISVGCLVLATACVSGIPSRPAGSGLPASLRDELDQTTQSRMTSAQNAADQASSVYLTLSGSFEQGNDVNLTTFSKAETQLLPPLQAAANALTALNGIETPDKQETMSTVREVFFNATQEMLKAINDHVQYYQDAVERTQTSGVDRTSAQAMVSLANAFEASEHAKRITASLGQFTTIWTPSEIRPILTGLDNQQAVVLNGVLILMSPEIAKKEGKEAYTIIVGSLSSPVLIDRVREMAIDVFGAEQVAFQQETVTPDQSNPAPTSMVIREDATTYRLINTEGFQLINRIYHDTRNLSASDWLYQSTVITEQKR